MFCHVSVPFITILDHDSVPEMFTLLHDSLDVDPIILVQFSLVTSKPKSDMANCEIALSEKEEAASDATNWVLLFTIESCVIFNHVSVETAGFTSNQNSLGTKFKSLNPNVENGRLQNIKRDTPYIIVVLIHQKM